ncbi:hypothetical protein D3093_14990 (plasmid) [Azospirillum argentinense]|uniref:Uncharacterized protein n=2 Tax=Azospirillum argentinense TaxID=2970906 RepID=A0A4D8PJK0_9PROT|nr:hypothetical protein D3093_14990 [Azospirillum argentinense]
MFAKLAAHHSDKLGTAEDEFYDFNIAMNFRALATCLHEFIDPDVEPSFEEPLRPDQAVQHVFALQLMNETNLHQAACMRAGLRRSWYDVERDYGELRLTKRRRRSALTLIDVPAQADLLQTIMGLKDGQAEQSEDAVYFAFASAKEHLKFVCEANPRSWANFEKATGVSAELLTGFSGFLVFLDFAAREVGHSLAYTDELLKKLAEIYKYAFPDSAVDADNVMALVQQFSLTAEQSCKLLLPVPFFRFGGRYLRYVGFKKIMAPAMGLLTILVRMHDNAWNNTVGSTLARAADVLAAVLPSFDRLKVAVRRNLKGGGDVDLALYDVESRHLLLCEVKTVYDKHRTVLHMHRFEEAKVNVARAVGQLRDATSAVNSGAVDMHALFQKKLPQPLKVSTGLLTWFDPVDLTIGTPDEDILSLNFATFRLLLDQSKGDVDLLCRTTWELRNIWCVSELQRIDLQTEFPTNIEVQIPVLDSAADFKSLSLTPLTRVLLDHLPALPDAWRMSDLQEEVVSYSSDTVAALGDQSA